MKLYQISNNSDRIVEREIMIQAWLLVVLAASGVAQADFVNRECRPEESIYDGPLASHAPIKYDVSLMINRLGNWIQSETVEIAVRADWSEGPEDPRDVIVLHADRALDVNIVSVQAYLRSAEDSVINIESACRDSKRQLIIVKLKEELKYLKYKIIANAYPPRSARSDGLGLQNDPETGLIEADFSDKQARLIMPCFDDPKYEAVFEMSFKSLWQFEVVSKTLKPKTSKQTTGMLMSEAKFYDTEPISFDRLSFSLKKVNR